MGSLVAERLSPPDADSRWYCNDPECDGKPHRGWEWPHARSSQQPPKSDWFVWVIMSGRGFGKSRSAAEWLLHEARQRPNTEWAVVAPTSGDTRKCAEDLTAGLVVIGAKYIANYNRAAGASDIFLTNGAVIHLVSADKPDRLRGFNLAGAWCDEVSSWRYPDTWHLALIPALRDRRADPRVVVTSTPKPQGLLRQLIDESKDTKSTVITRGSTFDNADNLSPKFIAEMRERYEGTRRGRQELYGELLSDVEGALVSQQMIDDARLLEMPPVALTRIVVAVDPAVTSGENSDETGIIVCAKGIDGRGYVLADLSCKDTPHGWAGVVAAAYEEFKADRVVAEKNQGFDMVEEIVRSVSPNIAYKGIVAKVGKKLRAEPIAALYEQGKISHIGYFTKLEDQWTQWVPDITNKSPDRLDALVHGFTELGMIGGGNTGKTWLESKAAHCHVCPWVGPLGTAVCPKCGTEIVVAPEDEQEEEPFSLSSGINNPNRPQGPDELTGANKAAMDAIRAHGPSQGYDPFRPSWMNRR